MNSKLVSSANTEKMAREEFGKGTTNPFEYLSDLMADPVAPIHSPIHHVLVGTALAQAYFNAVGEGEQEAKLAEIERRGKKVPPAICGEWGCCGAAVSCGIFASVITGANAQKRQGFDIANRMTVKALERIAKYGGPRCCKRCSYLSVLAAVEQTETALGVKLETPAKIVCQYSKKNKECIGRKCPFYPS